MLEFWSLSNAYGSDIVCVIDRHNIHDKKKDNINKGKNNTSNKQINVVQPWKESTTLDLKNLWFN